MMRAAPVAVALSIATSSVCAQPANEAVKALEGCFQLTRAADEICFDPAIGAVERLDCLKRARAAQLECLERIRPGMAAGSAPPQRPAGIVSPDSGLGAAPRELPRAAPPNAVVAPSLLDQAPALDKPAAAVAPKTPPRPAPPKTLAKEADFASKETDWTVSETTSPVDYSPLVTAVKRLAFGTKAAPDTLIIRCRGMRTELLFRTNGTWRAMRGGEVEVGYQIDESSPFRLSWALSADGKTVTYKNDAADLLRSLPDGAHLKINVLDAAGLGHEATFHLTELDAVLKKIAAACKWTPRSEKLSSQKR